MQPPRDDLLPDELWVELPREEDRRDGSLELEADLALPLVGVRPELAGTLPPEPAWLDVKALPDGNTKLTPPLLELLT